MHILSVYSDKLFDPVIYLVTVLFILSLITERATHFLKLNLDENNFLFTGRKVRLRTKSDIKSEEDKRERNIISISVLIGTLTAFFIKADIFSIFRSTPIRNSFGWEDYCISFAKWEYVGSFLTLLFGCFLTGLFTSLGSKFWHDLLDLLLESKNLKKKLNDQDTFTADSIASFDAYLKLTETDIYSKIIDQYRNKIWQNLNVISVELRFIESKHTLFIKTNNGLLPGIGKTIDYEYSTHKFKTIPVQVSKGDPIVPHASILYPSYSINSPSHSDTNWGSIGCFTRRLGGSETLMLTCYHVLKSESQKWERYDPIQGDSDKVNWISGKQKHEIGEILEGIRDYEIDAALVKLKNEFTPNNNLFEIGTLSSIRFVESKDLEANTTVSIFGGRSRKRLGRIVGYKSDVCISYSEGDHVLSQLIAIESLDENPFSQGGDSGSIVYDEKSRSAVGMLVAGNKSVSYAIPITIVFDKLKLTLIKTL